MAPILFPRPLVSLVLGYLSRLMVTTCYCMGGAMSGPSPVVCVNSVGNTRLEVLLQIRSENTARCSQGTKYFCRHSEISSKRKLWNIAITQNPVCIYKQLICPKYVK